jgi:hypothetical protein
MLMDIADYANETSDVECLTILSGNAVVDGVQLKTGMTIYIEPSEKLERLAIEKCIVARSLI